LASNYSFANGAVLFGALIIELLILCRAPDIAKVLNVVDHPDSVRKRHVRATPLVGGLAIMTSAVLSTAVPLIGERSAGTALTLALLLCGCGATLVGYADDQSSTSPSSRLLLLFLLSAISLVICPQLLPTSIHWSNFEPWSLAPWMSYALIAVAMVGLVNAINMADGQNGIVIGMYVIWSVCLLTATEGQTQSLALVLLMSCAIALIFNMFGRVFLGDAGTYGVTFIFGMLALRAHNSGAISAETLVVWFFIPIADCLRLMVSRIWHGQVPSDGDRNHFHHKLQDVFGSTYSCLIYLGTVAGSSILTTLMPRLSIVCLLFVSAFYVILMGRVSDEHRRAARGAGATQAGRMHSPANSNSLPRATRERIQKHH